MFGPGNGDAKKATPRTAGKYAHVASKVASSLGKGARTAVAAEQPVATPRLSTKAALGKTPSGLRRGARGGGAARPGQKLAEQVEGAKQVDPIEKADQPETLGVPLMAKLEEAEQVSFLSTTAGSTGGTDTTLASPYCQSSLSPFSSEMEADPLPAGVDQQSSVVHALAVLAEARSVAPAAVESGVHPLEQPLPQQLPQQAPQPTPQPRLEPVAGMFGPWEPKTSEAAAFDARMQRSVSMLAVAPPVVVPPAAAAAAPSGYLSPLLLGMSSGASSRAASKQIPLAVPSGQLGAGGAVLMRRDVSEPALQRLPQGLRSPRAGWASPPLTSRGSPAKGPEAWREAFRQPQQYPAGSPPPAAAAEPPTLRRVSSALVPPSAQWAPGQAPPRAACLSPQAPPQQPSVQACPAPPPGPPQLEAAPAPPQAAWQDGARAPAPPLEPPPREAPAPPAPPRECSAPTAAQPPERRKEQLLETPWQAAAPRAPAPAMSAGEAEALSENYEETLARIRSANLNAVREMEALVRALNGEAEEGEPEEAEADTESEDSMSEDDTCDVLYRFFRVTGKHSASS